jgi:hypothetical protein
MEPNLGPCYQLCAFSCYNFGRFKRPLAQSLMLYTLCLNYWEDLWYTKCSIINLVILTILVVKILLKYSEVRKEHLKSQILFNTLFSHSLFLKIIKTIERKDFYTLVSRVQNAHFLSYIYQKFKFFSDRPIKETHCKRNFFGVCAPPFH